MGINAILAALQHPDTQALMDHKPFQDWIETGDASQGPMHPNAFIPNPEEPQYNAGYGISDGGGEMAIGGVGDALGTALSGMGQDMTQPPDYYGNAAKTRGEAYSAPVPQQQGMNHTQLGAGLLLAMLAGRNGADVGSGYLKGFQDTSARNYQNDMNAANARRQMLLANAQEQEQMGVRADQMGVRADQKSDQDRKYNLSVQNAADMTAHRKMTEQAADDNAYMRASNAYKGAKDIGSMKNAVGIMHSILTRRLAADPNYVPPEQVPTLDQIPADFAQRTAEAQRKAVGTWASIVDKEANIFGEIPLERAKQLEEQKKAFAIEMGVNPASLGEIRTGQTERAKIVNQKAEEWGQKFALSEDKFAQQKVKEATNIELAKQRLSIAAQNANTFATNAGVNQYRALLQTYRDQANNFDSSIGGQLNDLRKKMAGSASTVATLGQKGNNRTKIENTDLAKAQAALSGYQGQIKFLEDQRDGIKGDGSLLDMPTQTARGNGAPAPDYNAIAGAIGSGKFTNPNSDDLSTLTAQGLLPKINAGGANKGAKKTRSGRGFSGNAVGG